MDDDSEHRSSSWSAAHIEAALDQALKLREAGNQAFQSGDYRISTKTYGDASYDVLFITSAHHLGAVPFNEETLLTKITKMQFLAFSNEAASWLKYEQYDGKVPRFRKALNCTMTAEEGLKEHPEAWKPSDGAMCKLLYRRALVCQGLKDYDSALQALKEAQRLGSKDPAILRLATKVRNIRELGEFAVEDGFVPWPESVESQLGLA